MAHASASKAVGTCNTVWGSKPPPSADMELNEEALSTIKDAATSVSDDHPIQESECWDYECSMSRENLSDVLYATIVCGGSVPDTFTLARNLEQDRQQNARNTACFRIGLPEGERERWEDIVGGELRERGI